MSQLLMHVSRASLTLILLLAGCSSYERPSLPNLSLPDPTYAKLPFVHRIDIQQGNVVTQEMIAQLELGMDKKKVLYVMGTPVIRDTFNAHRWDYLYTFEPEGDGVERRQVTLIFENDVLASIEGDVKPAMGRLVVDTRQDTTVEVPGVHKKGMLSKIKDSMPFVGDEEQTAEGESADETADQDEALIADDADTEGLIGDQDSEAADDEERLLADESSAEEESVIVPADAPKKEEKKRIFQTYFR